jgi:Peptidase C13 family
MAKGAALFVTLLFIGFLSIDAARAAVASPFADWAAVVVAGDHEDSDGNSTEGFDNARRDVSNDLLKLGFSPANLAQFSTRSREYRHEKLLRSEPNRITDTLLNLARKTRGGCLVYFSSHGEPDGLVVGDYVVPPRALAEVVDHACGTRPTVVILSACFSGVMLPPLKGPNRMILTAARRDRTSFGCGQADRYPYFDQCVLESLPASSDFPGLGRAVQACVAAREKKEGVTPASHPQLWIGPTAQTSLPRWR